MLNLLTNYEFDSVMHIHEHACTPYMCDEAFTLSRLHAVHVVFNMFETSHMYAVHVRCLFTLSYMYAVHLYGVYAVHV